MSVFGKLRTFGDRIALLPKEQEISYASLLQHANEVAEAAGKRCLVFLLTKNVPEAIAGYVGFLSHGIVPVMVDASLDAELLAGLVVRYRPSFIWTPQARKAEFVGAEGAFSLGDYVLLDRREAAPFPLAEELAILMTTSGSTGSPKLVRQSYANLEANTASIIEYLHITPEERAITNLPLHYVYGLSILNTYLTAGASLVVTEESLFSREFWRLMREQRVTSLGGVPYTYAMLKRLRFFRMDLPALRTLTQAGGKLDPELHAAFAEDCAQKGRRFFVMYGAAEATARMGYLPAELACAKVGSMGKAIPGGRFELLDDAGKIVTEAGRIGELVYYGDNVTMGYATSGKDLSRGDERQGRYVTGDLAQFDADGIYTIVGRKKRFLKIFGKRTNLEEVEHILRRWLAETGSSAEVACAGVDDHLYVFVTDEAMAGKVVPYLSSKLGLHFSAFAAKFIPALPKSASGKTLYRELEQYYDV